MSERVTDYYNQTALQYDQLHGGEQNLEHVRAIEMARPLLEQLDVRSAVDVGCGTGRSLACLAQQNGSLSLIGIDPSEGLLALAREKMPHAKFEVGHGESLPLENDSVDLAIATAIMHHVDHPSTVINEMFRVAKKAVLISDHNNFAFGGSMARQLRLWLYSSGLLPAATFVKQGFRKQGYSKDDGWWYPYSLFNDFGLISDLSAETYLFPTRPSTAKGNLLLAVSHFAILAVKARQRGHGAG